MNKYNATRLLGLFSLLLILPMATQVFAATATVTSARVTGANQVTIVFDLPLDFADTDFTNLVIDGDLKTVTIATGTGTDTAVLTFTGAVSVVPSATGTVDIGPLTNGISGDTFGGQIGQVLSDGQSPPAPVLSYSGSNPTNSNPVSFSVDFGEDINAATFVDTDVTVSSGTVQNIATIDGQNFTFEVLGATNGATLSVQITGDVDDLAGNTGSADSNIVLISIDLNGPALTIIGDNPRYVNFGAGYSDEGATAFDVGDGDLTGSIITTGLPIDTLTDYGGMSHIVTYSVTDSNGNLVTAQRIVNVGLKPAEGRSCGGDCYHPHFGVDQNGKTFYEDGLRVNNVIYKIDNVLHNHPDKIIELPVGVPVHFALKASDNYASQIRHMELALGIQKGHFDKQQASVIIDLDIDFQGNYVVSYEGDATLVRDVNSKVSILDKTVLWDLVFTPTQHLQHDMFAISAVDEYQYVGTYYINEGITFRGISQNGVPEFTYMDSRGHPHILTIADTTLEDLSVAVDEQGNKWTLDDTTQFWMKEYIRPDMTGSLSKFTGYDRNDYNEFKVYKQGQALIAAQKFDSSKIQGELEPTKSYDDTHYERGHNPVPNMIKAYIDYAKSRAGHS